MKISLKTAKPLDLAADLLVFAIPAFEKKKKAEVPAELAEANEILHGALAEAFKKEQFTGKRDQTLSFTTLGLLSAPKLVIVGLGSGSSDAELRTSFAKLGRLANAEKAKNVVVALPAELLGSLRPVAEGLTLGAYRFTKYLTGDRRPKAEIAQFLLATDEKVQGAHKKAAELGQSVGDAVNFARDLSNEPPNVLYPETFADAARALGKSHGLACKVFDYDAIRKEGMLLLQAVGQGSEHKPRLAHLTYTPKGGKAKKRIVVVGKGITFDSGGLSIKPGAGMGDMKHDMAGAANVLGFMQAVAALAPAHVEVHGIIACAENMPDGNAYRPGDIWGSYDGKTVEIVNTDAEGRLILADALTYAHRLQPDFLLDNATLTGACVVALGETCSGWYASSDEAAKLFQAAIDGSGEQMWRLPLLEELRDQLKTDAADLKHTGDRWGGSITAALFLREFIGETKHWVHCDVAGPSMGSRPFRWDPKGGSGHGVLTFLALIEQAAAELG